MAAIIKFFNSGVISPPNSLVYFLSLIFSLTSGVKTSRLSQSIAKDICDAVTRGRWKVPKHLLLSRTLRHWPGSAELIAMLNRYGHCQSYSMTVVPGNCHCSLGSTRGQHFTISHYFDRQQG